MEKSYRAKPLQGEIDMVALRESVRARISKSLAILADTEQRHAGYIQRWLDRPEFRAALHRHDGDGKERGV